MNEDSKKKKLRDVVDFLEYDELQKIRRDLETGGFHLLKYIKQKIKEEETKHKKFCSFCGNKLDSESIHNYTIVFGPYDFRKKATFCGMDCLNSFLHNLKEQRKNN